MVDYTSFYDALKNSTMGVGDITKIKKPTKPILDGIDQSAKIKPNAPVKATEKNSDLNNIAKSLDFNRGIQSTLAGLGGLVQEKGKGLIDSLGTAQKSFYQGQIPNDILAKIASPSIGAGTGFALGSSLPLASPVNKALASFGGAAIGAGLGFAGAGQVTPDQKKAAQIRSKEAGFEKQFSNPQQWGYNASSILKSIPQTLTDLGSLVTGTADSIPGGIGKALKETNIAGIKDYGDMLEKSSQRTKKASDATRDFLTDKINYISNLAYKPKNEEDGYKKAIQLPYEVIQHMTPEALKAMVKGENFDKVSIPDAVSEAYNKSQARTAQTKMVQEFKKAGKSDEEINKLVNFGMAGAPLEGIAQALTSDPTMLLDPALAVGKGVKGVARLGEGIQKANKLKAINTDRQALQLKRALTPIEDTETGQLAMKGLLPNSEIPKKPSIIENPIKNEMGSEPLIDPNQTKLDLNGELKPKALPSPPEQKLLPAPENINTNPEIVSPQANQLAKDIEEETNALSSNGVDFENDIDGYEQLIDNLKAKGHNELDIISHLNGETPKGELPIAGENISATQPNSHFDTPEYDNPDENHLYDLIKGDNQDTNLQHQFTNQGGIPLGFYEGEKRIPIYSDVENNVLKRLPVNFEFQHPLEKELFNLGSDYVDWARDPKKIEEIKNAQNLQRDKTAKAVYLDKNIGDKYNQIGSNLLLGTKDPNFIDNLGLPEKGQKEVKDLLKTFVQKIYSGGKNAKGGKLGEGVLGHVPNAIRKDLLQQIGTKLGLEGKTAAEKKAILEGLNSLGDESFKLKGDAYKGLISHTKEFRTKFKNLLNKYKNEMI